MSVKVVNREFEVEAVRRITGGGASLAEVAREPGRGESMLRAWERAPAAGGGQALPGRRNPPAVEEEPRRPRAEVGRFIMGRVGSRLPG